MNKYGRKTIVEEGQFVEGLIVEVREADPSEVVCRKYYKENGEELVEDDMYKLDIVPAIQKKTPSAQMKELAAQIGTNNFYISRSVVDILEV